MLERMQLNSDAAKFKNKLYDNTEIRCHPLKDI